MSNWQSRSLLHVLKLSSITVTALVLPVQAEIVTDGSLGAAQKLDGPNFIIGAQLGRQEGTNLFHSFETFNLTASEQATFHGPTTIENVISRVTGGQPSTINGLLTSMMPLADLYFINPAGVVFGESAQLNLPGSLYVSTADYLKLGEQGRFDAKNPANSTFTVAPPSAFGFLDTSVAPITVDKSYLQVMAPTVALINAIREGTEIPSNTLALIGGDITIHGETTLQNESPLAQGILLSFAGEVDLVSVASRGEVLLDPLRLIDTTFSQLGTVQITDTTQGDANFYRLGNIDTSGPNSGKVNIFADTLLLDNAYIFSDTFGDQDGHGINIQVRNAVNLENSARITADVFKEQGFPSEATGNASDIHISAREITLQDGSQVTSNSLALNNDPAQGNGGTITLAASDQITITGYSQLIGESESGRMNSGILTDTQTIGHGGEVIISTDKLVIDEVGEIRAHTSGLGDAGNVSLQVGTLSLNNGAQINVSAGHLEEGLPTDTGKGGQLQVEAREAIVITGEKIGDLYRPSGLISNTFSANQGGTITLETPQLTVENKGTIQAGTAGHGGDAGHIQVKTNHLRIQNANLTTQAKGSDRGGTISITAQTVELQEQATISSESMGSGNAGNVEINSKNLILKQSHITTHAEDAEGGNIIIKGGQFLYLADSQIEVKARGLDTENGGGNITLADTEMLITNDSQLDASAIGGAGGNIRIVAGHFIKSADSALNVTSQLNVDGEISIESTKEETMDNLVVLSSNLLDVSNLLKNPCSTLNLREQDDRFIVLPYRGSPPSPDDLQTSLLRTGAQMLPVSDNVSITSMSKLALTTCQRK